MYVFNGSDNYWPGQFAAIRLLLRRTRVHSVILIIKITIIFFRNRPFNEELIEKEKPSAIKL